MIPPRFSINEPARSRMLALARERGWPRIVLGKTGTGVDDAVAGVTGWFLLAEQVPADVIANATAKLLAPPEAPLLEGTKAIQEEEIDAAR